MRVLICILVMSLCLVSSGCKEFANSWPGRKPKKVAKTVEPKKADDINLSKIILKPKREKPNVSRDPFAPLLGQDSAANPRLTKDVDELQGLEYLGVIKNQDEFSALLKFESKRMVKKIDDEIKGYRIVEMNPEELILTNGIKTKTVKRGAEK